MKALLLGTLLLIVASTCLGGQDLGRLLEEERLDEAQRLVHERLASLGPGAERAGFLERALKEAARRGRLFDLILWLDAIRDEDPIRVFYLGRAERSLMLLRRAAGHFRFVLDRDPEARPAREELVLLAWRSFAIDEAAKLAAAAGPRLRDLARDAARLDAELKDAETRQWVVLASACVVLLIAWLRFGRS